MYSVELTFDPDTEAELRALCEELDEHAIPSLAASGVRPHLSLAVGEGFEHVNYSGLATSLPPFPTVGLPAVATFPGDEGVLFAAVQPSHELLDFHETFHRYVYGIPIEQRSFYLPGSWMPHVTLAVGLQPRPLASGVLLAQRHLPIAGPTTALWVVDVASGQARQVA